MRERQITDFSSFETVTGGDKGLAALYFWLKLDPLVELAFAISSDFFARPKMYRALSDDIAEELAVFHARCGTDERIPSLQQRAEIFAPLFGSVDTPNAPVSSPFCQLRDAVLHSAERFREQPAEGGLDMLKEDLRSNVRLFRDWLANLGGASVRWSSGQALPTLTEKRAYRILRDGAVTAVFGITSELDPAWPYCPSPVADTFIEEASRQLSQLGAGPTILPRDRIGNLQRLAVYGAEAIALALDGPDDAADDPGPLITTAYLWLSALRTMGRSGTASLDSGASSGGLTRVPYLPPLQTTVAA